MNIETCTQAVGHPSKAINQSCCKSTCASANVTYMGGRQLDVQIRSCLNEEKPLPKPPGHKGK